MLLTRYRTGGDTVLPELWKLDPQLLEYAASEDKLTPEEIPCGRENVPGLLPELSSSPEGVQGPKTAKNP